MFKRFFNLFRKKNKTHDDNYEYIFDREDDDYREAFIRDREKATRGSRVDTLDEGRELTMPIRRRIDYTDKSERLLYIRDNCEQILAAQKNIDDIRDEYAAVSEYLADVQKINMLPEDKMKELRAKVIKVRQLGEEKETIKNRRKSGISDERYDQMAAGADTIPKDIKQLEEYEEYQRIIEDDMRKLEGERGSITYEKKLLDGSQELLKFIMTTLLMGVVILACLFLCINKLFDSDMMIPFLIVVLAAAIVCVVVTLRSNVNRKTVKENAAKMNRLVELVNKTKIKYVNNKNIIDYMYEKYDIRSSMELKQYWGEYQKKKENESEYIRNAKLLDSYSMLILDELNKIGVNDTDIWLHQLDAIVDEGEMKQLVARLESRREKLHHTITYNNNLRDEGMEAIKDVIAHNSDYKIEVVAILKRYGVTL